jgi:hypothetical protein
MTSYNNQSGDFHVSVFVSTSLFLTPNELYHGDNRDDNEASIALDQQA